MFCNKCGNPLPKNGAVCNFCGTMMSKEQIKENLEEKNNNEFKPELLSEKYGQTEKIQFRDDNKDNENKVLGLAIVVGVVVFIIVLAIIINVLR